MSRYSPSGKCCGQSCAVVSSSPMLAMAHLTPISGTWAAESGVLTGSDDGAVIVTKQSASGAQYVELVLTANVAGQVIDILLGCDAVGQPDLYARLTFGNSAVTGSCGTFQLFHAGVALEAATPVFALIDGQAFTVSLCTDAELSKVRLQIASLATVTAALPSDAEGRLGFRIVDAAGGDVAFSAATWSRLFVTGSDCEDCDICGTGFGWMAGPDSVSTCEHTIAGPYVHWTGDLGWQSVESHQIVSALDRDRGYGVRSFAWMDLDSGAFVFEVSLDNGHYVARLHVSEVIESPCNGVGNTHLEFYVEILKDGASLGVSDTVCVPGGTTAHRFDEDCGLRAWFCDGSFHASGGTTGQTVGVTAVSAQVGDGSTYAATIDQGGVYRLDLVRCLNCAQCENCEDVANERQWQVEIEAEPNTLDGTYILTSGSSDVFPLPAFSDVQMCQGAVDPEDINTMVLILNRSHLFFGRLNGIPGAANIWDIEGKSPAPLIDCENVVDEVIPITGVVTGTATVTAL